MLGIKVPTRRNAKDEAEKPFWISYSDMMTALMVLFLVAMTVALLAVTKEISEAERQKVDRVKEIEELLRNLEKATENFPGIEVRGHAIDFGERARFGTDSHKLSREQAILLREFVPQILKIARDPLGEKWLKRVIVEGFADPRGTYLHNLNLSLQRSERILCILLSKPEVGEAPLSENDRLLIREIFLVGGSSFNFLKPSLEESRRIEFKLEFLEMGEKRPIPPGIPLDENRNCPLDN